MHVEGGIHDVRVVVVFPARAGRVEVAEHGLVIGGEDFDEVGQLGIPILQDPCRDGGAGPGRVRLDQRLERRLLIVIFQRRQFHRAHVAESGEGVSRVVDIGDATGHAGGEVATGRSEHDGLTARHILTGMVAHALDDHVGPRVADAETFAGGPANIGVPAGRTEEADIADDGVGFGHEGGAFVGVDAERAAGEALAEVVVGIALELQVDPVGQPASEALSGRSLEFEGDGTGGQASLGVALRYLVRQDGPGGAIGIDDLEGPLDWLTILDGGPGRLQQLPV